MPKKKTRVTRTRSAASDRERMAFPILVALVMGVIIAGMFLYTGLLVVGSAIFVGYFGWLWWARRAAAATKTPARDQRKPRARKHSV
jgi:Flp pilus assembly protein TadB